MSDALTAYEGWRRPRTARIQQLSRRYGWVYHLGAPLASFRNLAAPRAGAPPWIGFIVTTPEITAQARSASPKPGALSAGKVLGVEGEMLIDEARDEEVAVVIAVVQAVVEGMTALGCGLHQPIGP